MASRSPVRNFCSYTIFFVIFCNIRCSFYRMNLTTLSVLLVDIIKSPSVQVFGYVGKIGSSAELWDMFAIVVKGFASRRKAFADCCPGYTWRKRHRDGHVVVEEIPFTHTHAFSITQKCLISSYVANFCPLQYLTFYKAGVRS